MTNATRQTLEAKLAKKCAKLYDARTSRAVRRDLSLEVSFLRAQLGCVGIEAMSAASLSPEES